MLGARLSGSRTSQILNVLIRHERRVSVLVAIAAVFLFVGLFVGPFGAAPVLAQTVVTEAQPGPAAARVGPLAVVTSSVSRVLAIVRSEPADETESGKRRAGGGQGAAGRLVLCGVSPR